MRRTLTALALSFALSGCAGYQPNMRDGLTAWDALRACYDSAAEVIRARKETAILVLEAEEADTEPPVDPTAGGEE